MLTPLAAVNYADLQQQVEVIFSRQNMVTLLQSPQLYILHTYVKK